MTNIPALVVAGAIVPTMSDRQAIRRPGAGCSAPPFRCRRDYLAAEGQSMIRPPGGGADDEKISHVIASACQTIAVPRQYLTRTLFSFHPALCDGFALGMIYSETSKAGEHNGFTEAPRRSYFITCSLRRGLSHRVNEDDGRSPRNIRGRQHQPVSPQTSGTISGTGCACVDFRTHRIHIDGSIPLGIYFCSGANCRAGGRPATAWLFQYSW